MFDDGPRAKPAGEARGAETGRADAAPRAAQTQAPEAPASHADTQSEAALAARAETAPAVFAFVEPVIDAVDWWAVLVAILVAVFPMLSYLSPRHPDLLRRLVRG